ncbi:hypothetical protein GCM10027034_20190 [Ramlibacter solisilvae]
MGVSLRKLHHLRAQLPKPVVLGPRHVRWRRSDLEEWVAALPTEERREEPVQLARGKALKRGDAAVG